MADKLKDEALLIRGKPADPVMVSRTCRDYVLDSRGKRYIDFLGGWSVSNYGWENEVILKAMREYEGPDYVYPYFMYSGWLELAELLASMAPGKLERCLRATGGTEAVDLAMQLAMHHTGRSKFLSIFNSYHGNSLATASLASQEFRRNCKFMTRNVRQVKPPLDDAALSKISAALKRRDIAAFIMEPVILNLGVLIPSQSFMSELQALCRKHGTLLVMDEVASGFGRTGKIFASEHYGIEPDMMCMAKGISGGYAPLGAAIVTEEVSRSAAGKLWHHSTYGWHPRSVHAAKAAIGHLLRNKSSLLANVKKMSGYIDGRIRSMAFDPAPVEIRTKGLAIGIELSSAEQASRIFDRCLAKGLMISLETNFLCIFPPLDVGMSTAADGMDILAECAA